MRRADIARRPVRRGLGATTGRCAPAGVGARRGEAVRARLRARLCGFDATTTHSWRAEDRHIGVQRESACGELRSRGRLGRRWGRSGTPLRVRAAGAPDAADRVRSSGGAAPRARRRRARQLQAGRACHRAKGGKRKSHRHALRSHVPQRRGRPARQPTCPGEQSGVLVGRRLGEARTERSLGRFGHARSAQPRMPALGRRASVPLEVG